MVEKGKPLVSMHQKLVQWLPNKSADFRVILEFDVVLVAGVDSEGQVENAKAHGWSSKLKNLIFKCSVSSV